MPDSEGSPRCGTSPPTGDSPEVVVDPAAASRQPEAADLSSANSREPAERPAEAIRRHGIKLQPEEIQLLERYCDLLWDWNTKLNLTRHNDAEAFVTRDLVDTRRLAAQIGQGLRVLDIGSGGGVPGIPLAILRPDLNITLAESVQKKSAVLQTMVKALRIRVAVQADRAENVLRRQKFDVVTARAVAPLPKILTWLQPVWKSTGQLLLIKGQNWTAERELAAAAGQLDQLQLTVVDSWPTVGRDSDSVLLRVCRRGANAAAGGR